MTIALLVALGKGLLCLLAVIAVGVVFDLIERASPRAWAILFVIAALFVPVTFIALLMRDLMAQGFLSSGGQVLLGLAVFLLLFKSLFIVMVLRKSTAKNDPDPVPRNSAELALSRRELLIDFVIAACALTANFAANEGAIAGAVFWIALAIGAGIANHVIHHRLRKRVSDVASVVPNRSLQETGKSKRPIEPVKQRSGSAWRDFLNVGVPIIAGFVFLAIVMGAVSLWDNWTRSKAPAQISGNETEAAQHAYSKELLSAASPCAVKGKNYSDVKQCSLFGIRLGMSPEDVIRKIKSSAFFPDVPEFIKGCNSKNKKCVGYVSDHKDGFTIIVDFEPASDGSTELSALIAAAVVLWLEPGANPYFDPQSMLPVFVRLIGEPDLSWDRGYRHRWGDLEDAGVPNILAAATNGMFLIALSRGGAGETSLSSNDPQLLREARR
jgi:hypothetical protein